MLRLFGLTFLMLSFYSASSNGQDKNNLNETNNDLFKLSGYLMIDHDYFSPFYHEETRKHHNRTEIRRSKIGISFKPNQYIKGKFQLKYAQLFPNEGKVVPGDIYLRFKYHSNIAIQIGHMKEPYGLEQQTSSTELIAIERSLPTTVFSPTRSYGLLVDSKHKDYTLAGGYFINKNRGREFLLTNFDLLQREINDTEALTLRLTAAPIHEKNKTLHMGSSISKRWLYDDKFQIKSRGGIHTGDKIIRSPRFYADESKLYQIDIAFQQGSFLTQAEFFINQVEQTDNNLWNFYGGYIQASYKLFGSYQYKKGSFRSLKNNNDTSIEWVIRHAHINLQENHVGSAASSSLLGINLQLNSNIKLMLNTNIPWVAGDIINTYQSGRSYSLRAQFNF